MDRDMRNSEPVDRAAEPVVYKPKEAFNVRTVSTSVGLIVVCLLLTIPAIASGSVGGMIILPVIVLVMALTLWTYLRRRVTITSESLIVQGRLTRIRVRLADITAIHHEKNDLRTDRYRLITWVAATGQRPFRIYYLEGQPEFVADLRRRAAARGATLDVDAEDLAKAPTQTRKYFTLL